jgi:hypothetical protein
VRFLRHLAAACLVVAVVVVLGLAWNHFAARTLVGTLPGRPYGLTVRPTAPKVFGFGTFDLGLNSMLQPVNWHFLEHTVVIEAAVMAAVVIFEISRRRSRRASRAAQLAEPPPGEDEDPDQYRA